MLSYILKRIALMVPTLLGVLTLTFVVIQFVPGGPVEQLMAEARAQRGGGAEGGGGGYSARRDIDAKQVEELKKLYGFDKPAHVRYVEMLKSFASFDLGTSFMQNKPVWSLIKEKLPVSISLGLWTFLISYLISLPLGILLALGRRSRTHVSLCDSAGSLTPTSTSSPRPDALRSTTACGTRTWTRSFSPSLIR